MTRGKNPINKHKHAYEKFSSEQKCVEHFLSNEIKTFYCNCVTLFSV